MARNKKWQKFLEFESIRTYLNGSIGSKSDVIGDSVNLEQKIESVNLTNFLSGISIFLTEYSEDFNYPHEIISYYDEIRTDKKAVNEFKQKIEDFIVWLKNEKILVRGRNKAPKEICDLVGKVPYSEIYKKFDVKSENKGLAPSTAINIQAQFRGFLTWNNINLKFKNYDEMSETAKEQSKYDIKFHELNEMGKLVIDYAPDLELRLVLRWLRDSGLGSAEILMIRMGDLRHKDWEKSIIRIDKTRKKTGVQFTTFLMGDLKEDIKKFMLNSENVLKSDEDRLFGAKDQTREQNYNNLERRFKRAYERMIEEHFPNRKSASRALFTMHKYRHIMQTICEELRIPKYIEDRFVAHKPAKLEKRYKFENKIEKYYRMIHDYIHGVAESSTREEIKEEIRSEIMDALFNRGASKSEYKKSRTMTPEEIQKLNSNIKTKIMVEEILTVAKDELLKDDAFILSVAERIKNLQNF